MKSTALISMLAALSSPSLRLRRIKSGFDYVKPAHNQRKVRKARRVRHSQGIKNAFK